MRLPSRRCSLSSLPVLTGLLLLAAGAAWAGPGRSVLVLPVTAQSVAPALAAAVGAALPAALHQAGVEAVTAALDSPFVQRAVAEGVADTSDLEGSRFALALAAGTDAVLTCTLANDEAKSVLRSELAGTIAQRAVSLTASSADKGSDALTAQDLAAQLAAALTPEAWEKAGADAAGRADGAKARYAAGQAKMKSGDAKGAVVDFRAALTGAPDTADYLDAAAEAEMQAGQPESAYLHLQALTRQRPDDAALKLRLGEAALAAGHPNQAEAAFRSAPADDPQAVEGVARALRARGEVAASRDQYQHLLDLLPGLRDEPKSIATLLSEQKEDAVRLATAPPDQVKVQIALLYLRSGDADSGLLELYRYHRDSRRPAYNDRDYLYLAHGFDDLARDIAGNAARMVELAKPAERDGESMEKALDSLHTRSSHLADVGELMKTSQREDAAHRYRVLGYELLNESNYEALLYVRTNDDAHQRRSDLLREACLKALDEAASLEEPAA